MNSYESGSQRIIPAVLVYIYRLNKGKREYLMLHRVKKQGDYHMNKWNGLGGKMDLSETPFEAAVREVWEESSLKIKEQDFNLLGNIHFPNFKPDKKEDWLCYVFTAEIPYNDSLELNSSDEGELSWIDAHEVLKLNLWAGDLIFLPHVMKSQKFISGIHYKNGDVEKSWII